MTRLLANGSSTRYLIARNPCNRKVNEIASPSANLVHAENQFTWWNVAIYLTQHLNWYVTQSNYGGSGESWKSSLKLFAFFCQHFCLGQMTCKGLLVVVLSEARSICGDMVKKKKKNACRHFGGIMLRVEMKIMNGCSIEWKLSGVRA